MEIRFQNNPDETMQMNTGQLRKNFLIQAIIQDNSIQLTYSHYDRMIIGGAKPVNKILQLPNHDELKAEYFLERREIGIINVGAKGVVTADGKKFELEKLDCLYLGKGTKKVSFASANKNEPAVFYLLSAPAHHKYTSRLMKKEKASPVNLGESSTSNKRTIYKYIHPDGIKSCQLVMGLTVLDPGSVWNSVPPHTHTRRMEVYFYFDVPETQRVFHFMGKPQETRHIVIANHEAVISPPWSVHYGCGTSNYGFIWGMAGENQVFSDMDQEPVKNLK
ncbi:MAG: 5-dehydro-4-deoxy-D-glucuronate isomerase [Bacteroidetes bacterium]|nr:5-dehydro-4-deoxy-D-glucuronate isomerase [Bacteroidota bacterium]MBS1931863.1 5-dehydro-4-deoxy-D-glucuronate isomerase [Bacteroidota bacterium]